jgi:hypothetical protein
MRKYPFHTWILLLALAVPDVTSARAYHAFHTSLAQVSYNSKTQLFEVSLRVFTDDFEEVLSKEANRKVSLDESTQHDQLIEAYIKKQFGLLDQHGRKRAMTFVGKEFEADATWIYLEIPFQEKGVELRLQNALLTDLFDDQTNVVNLTYFSSRKTYLFKSDNTTQVLVL